MNPTQLYYLLIIVLFYAATVQQAQQQQQQPHMHYSTTMCLKCVNVIAHIPKIYLPSVLLVLVTNVCFRAH